MEKVKVFHGTRCAVELEDEMNEWLGKHPAIQINERLMQASGGGGYHHVTVVIFYREDAR